MDVTPMVTACKSWIRYYHDTDKIDVLKDTIGLPSIARRRMYEAASMFPGFMGFSLTGNSHQNLEKLIVSNTFGGLSIIFTRYHEAGKTRLRELVSQTEPDGAGDHTYCQPVECQMGWPNYVSACWDMIRTPYIRGANPSSYLWGPVCTTKWTRLTQKDGSNRLWSARSSASCK